MRIVIQRVKYAAVCVEGKCVGEIQKGLMVLVGIEKNDTRADAEWLAAKTAAMRIFDDAQGVMNLCVCDINGEVLSISQFTLMASTRKGNRPSYIKAALPEMAIELYNYYSEKVGELIGKPVEKGIFGADMKVELCNDGPVTIIVDSHIKE